LLTIDEFQIAVVVAAAAVDFGKALPSLEVLYSATACIDCWASSIDFAVMIAVPCTSVNKASTTATTACNSLKEEDHPEKAFSGPCMSEASMDTASP
jgi:hypothetical protein